MMAARGTSKAANYVIMICSIRYIDDFHLGIGFGDRFNVRLLSKILHVNPIIFAVLIRVLLDKVLMKLPFLIRRFRITMVF